MNRERRRGRRSVVQSQVQKSSKLLTPEYEEEQTFATGPKKALFNDDTSFVMRRSTLKPLHEINNFQFSPSKSKSHEKLPDETTYAIPSFMETFFSKHSKIPLSPQCKSKFIESSILKRREEPIEPVLQSKDLFNSLIDSPCTKYEKLQYNNALSSASKLLINRHLQSVNENSDIFKKTSPEMNMSFAHRYNIDECKTVNLPNSNGSYNTTEMNLASAQNFNISESETVNLPNSNSSYDTTVQQKVLQTDCQIQTSDVFSAVENIEELKENQMKTMRQLKLKCNELIKKRYQEMELELEKHFSVVENKIAEDFDELLNKIKFDENDKTVSTSLDTTVVETVREKNYTRMTGTYGILNNMKQDCSFLKTPKTKGKSREEMLKQGVLTPCSMSFVLQDQLMKLNSSS